MLPTNQPFSSAVRASFEPPLARFTVLTYKTIKNSEKLIGIHVNASKVNLEKSTASIKQLLPTQDLQERSSLLAERTRKNIEAIIFDSRYMADVVFTARNEFTKAIEAQTAEFRRQISTAFDQMARIAPASAEAGIALQKSRVDSIYAEYERWANAIRQAVAAMEAQITAAADQASRTAEERRHDRTTKNERSDCEMACNPPPASVNRSQHNMGSEAS